VRRAFTPSWTKFDPYFPGAPIGPNPESTVFHRMIDTDSGFACCARAPECEIWFNAAWLIWALFQTLAKTLTRAPNTKVMTIAQTTMAAA
jgi:hypothetical protein